jgi:CheY-like chemotaxis protein
VLVVDDEPMLGASLERLLASEHEVTTVPDGADALELLAGGAAFDVILCDLMMPNMTGMDLHRELERIDPALLRRLVFITGGAFTPRAACFLDTVANPRLKKPVDPRRLREVIREVLGAVRANTFKTTGVPVADR